jgi:phosphatidylinositol alpha-mannosyltransferase
MMSSQPNVSAASRASLSVALINPTNWPQVRRGTERFLNEFAFFLAGRGHSVRVICGKSGAGETVTENGFVTEYHRSLWFPALARFGVLDFHLFPLTTLRRLIRGRFDIVHCFNFADALVADYLRPFHRARVVLHLTSTPPSVQYRRSLSTDGAVLGRVMRNSDAVLTVGKDQAEYYETRFKRRCVRLQGPVDLSAFPLNTKRNQEVQTILCASALEDRRKGGRVLMRSFNLLKKNRPYVQLQISAAVSEGLREMLIGLVEPQWQCDLKFLGTGDLPQLPSLLGSASVVVVPSLWEAFSLVILEALACGTPVVATAPETGPHEVISENNGRTFHAGPIGDAEPTNAEGLAQMLQEALDMSRDPETPRRCRATVEHLDWPRLGRSYEEFYFSLVEKKRL